MYATSTAMAQMQSVFLTGGIFISAAIATVMTAVAGLLGLGFSLEKVNLWIYNGGLGERFRNFGTPPWKGYNRWRSRKWNMEHSL